MFLRLFLWREFITSVRCARVIYERLIAGLLVAGVVVGYAVVWDQQGWDRSSVSGAAQFGLATFSLIVAAQVILVIGVATLQIAGTIASERDRKSLDLLLTTRLSSAEIVLGSMASGMVRYANGVIATMPIVVLMTFLGGIDGRLLLLTIAGLATTAFFLAGLAMVASVGAKTEKHAVTTALGYILSWLCLPLSILTLKRVYWPSGPSWIVPAARCLLDTSPMGLLSSLSGILTQPGGLVEAVIRMISWQIVGSVVLIGWGIVRLRPASRTLYDVEGQTLRLRWLRAAMRRPFPRSTCGDDPVFWNERYAYQSSSRVERVMNRLCGWVSIGCVVLVTSWFGVPAFAELVERGYGAFPEAFTCPNPNPFARVIVNKILMSSVVVPAPGLARQELNIALRLTSAMLSTLFIVATAAAGTLSIQRERKCDTWLGLISTPLTGWEILRAKMLGAIWNSRAVAILLVGLWTVGLLAGAIHPLGFLAALVWLAVSGGLYAALGVSSQLRTYERGELNSLNATLVRGLAGATSTLVALIASVVCAWVSLFTYEDIHAVIHVGPFPQFSSVPLYKMLGARTVATLWLFVTAAQAAGAFFLTRAMCRGFDATVGRPTLRP